MTGTDVVLLISLVPLVLTGWFLVYVGVGIARWTVYTLLIACGVQVLFHPAVLTVASFGLLIGGLLLALVSMGLLQRTLHKLPKLMSAGRFSEVNVRQLAAISLWIAGSGCVMTVIHPVLAFALTAGVASWVWWVLRPSGRAIRTHVSVEIRCSPAEAFAVVGDPRQFTRYVEDLELDVPADRKVGVGYRYHVRLRRPHGYVYEGDEEIVEYQPGRLIKERVVGRPPAVGTCTVELAPGGTRVIYDYESLISVPQALLGLRDATTIKTTAARQRAWQRLKALLEAPPDSSASVEPVS